MSSGPSINVATPSLPWAGRFYAFRVVLVAMALAIVAVRVAMCTSLGGYDVFLFLFGATYPHVCHFFLARLEGRRRSGRTSLLIDGFFAGSVMPALAFAPVPCAVLVVINLFNWIALSGPWLAVGGAVTILVGVEFGTRFQAYSLANSACGPMDLMAYLVLLAYIFLVAWVVFRFASGLRARAAELQVQKDAAEAAGQRAERALLMVLPATAARELRESGRVATATVSDSILVMVRFSADGGPLRDIARLGDLFRTCDEIFSRHGLEPTRTFGPCYLTRGIEDTAADDAMSAAQELVTFLRDQESLEAESGPKHAVRVFIHCGDVDSGMVQSEKFSYDLLGQGMDELHRLASTKCDAEIVVSQALRQRLRGPWQLDASSDGVTPVVYSLVGKGPG